MIESGQGKKVVVFTDMDGTLLDAKSYDFKGAEDTVALLAKCGIPLVLASSKTRSEIEYYRERLGNTHPFITENGGGVFIPKGYFSGRGEAGDEGYEQVSLGVTYAELRRAIVEIRDELSLDSTAVRGFGDMDAEEVSRVTGLSLPEASRAKARDYDEPFLCDAAKVNEETLKALLKAIEGRGLGWTRGSFFHILGAETDKGRGLKYLRERYEESFGPLTVVALGDGLNDKAMLAKADIAVLMAKPDGSYEDIGNVEGLIKHEGSGPKAWSKALKDLDIY